MIKPGRELLCYVWVVGRCAPRRAASGSRMTCDSPLRSHSGFRLNIDIVSSWTQLVPWSG
jgi:hypothetical protein